MTRGYGSKHGDSDKSGNGWDHTTERLLAAPPPPPSLPPSQFLEEEERGKWEEIRSEIELVVEHIRDGGGRGSL